MNDVITFLEKRDFVDQKTHENLGEILQTPASVYLGIDPTAPSLHLGNLVGIIALMHFQRMGHRPVILVGGATGLIGDPSGKDKERPLLTPEMVKENAAALEKQLSRFFRSDEKATKPLFVNNFNWFSQMNSIEFLRDIGKQFRIGQMMGKESVRARLQSEEGMSFTEFSYQLLQGYDFYYLFKHHNVTVQIGGSDQFGNITAGIEYVRRVEGKSVYGMTFPLLTRSDGKKFGKSEKGAIWLSAELCSPYELYQYLYRTPDQDVVKMMKMLTLMEIAEIHKIEKEMNSPSYVPNSAQKRFAEEVTKIVHGEKGLKEAREASATLQPGKMEFNEDNLLEIAKTIPNVSFQKADVIGTSFADIAVKGGLLTSKSEVRRLIQNNGAYLNGQKVSDPNLTIGLDHLLKGNLLLISCGKKKSLLIQLI